MGFELGETYSGYKFIDVLKRTKNGVEYRVQNTCLQRMELLRALPASAANDQEQNERFLRETRLLAQLKHPNIVTLFNAFEIDRQLVMTVELIEGTSLDEHLHLARLGWREAMGLFRQALGAIGFAHEQGIVHRDIAPENILLTPEGVLKLTNFAFAKSAASPKLTQVGVVIGNLKYISPEQVKGTGDLDARSDIYSLGIVLYEMLCARTPFHSASQFELMAAHVNETPLPPSQWNPDVPAQLDSVVLTAIAKDPAARYQTAQEFEQALLQAEAVIEALPQAGASVPEPPVALAMAAAAAASPANGITTFLPPALIEEPAVAEALAPVIVEPQLLSEPELQIAAAAIPVPAPVAIEPDANAPVFLAARSRLPWLLYSGAAVVFVCLVLMMIWMTAK